MSDSRIPVTLFTGFLGSGKTTLLNRLIGSPAFSRAAVVINEFGEISIDHLLVEARSDHLVVLDNGCICCSARGDLASALRALGRERAAAALPFDRVLVETTGLADPVPLMETLCEDAHMVAQYRPHGIVTLIDALNGRAQLDTYAEPMKQVATADRLLLSKCDLASPAALDELEERLSALNPGAPIVRIVTNQADASIAFGSTWRPEGEGTFDWTARAAEVQERFASDRRAHLASAQAVRPFTLWRERPATRAGLVLWLDKLAGLKGDRLLRAKGILNVEGEPVAVHAVQRIVHEPVFLPRWPDAERRSRLVFITLGIERAAIESTLDALDFTLAKDAIAGPAQIDPQAYARFVAASGLFRP